MARGVGTGFVLDSFGEPLHYFYSPCTRFELLAHCEGSIDLDCVGEGTGWDYQTQWRAMGELSIGWRCFVMMRVYWWYPIELLYATGD